MSGEPVVARMAPRRRLLRGGGLGPLRGGRDDPFLSHAFLSALEESGSAVAATGWRPLPIAIDGTDARPGGGDAGLC